MGVRLGTTAALGGTLLLAVLPYAQTLSFGFTFDDANTICGHRGVQEALSFDDLFLRDFWGRSRFDTVGVWRPLTTFSFWIDQRIGGGHAWPFHLSNLLWYVALLALGASFLARWCERELSDWARWLSLGAFATLAIHADVVPSATGRAETMAAFFSLAALAIATREPLHRARDVLLSTLALLFALLSKESSTPMAALLPFLAMRAHPIVTRDQRRALVALASVSALVTSAVWAFRAVEMPFASLLASDRALDYPLLGLDAPHRLLGACDLLALRLRHVVTGAGLVPDYGFSEPPVLRDGPAGIAIGGAVVAASLALVVAYWKRAPRIADATIGFGASYAAMSNVFTGASAFAERHFFFPSFWLIVMVALLAERTLRTPAVRTAAFAVGFAFTLFQARQAALYASTWRDDVTLFSASVHTYPNVSRAQRNLAHALAELPGDSSSWGARSATGDDSAFHLTAAEVIAAHFPVPVARDVISPAWDEEALPARLAHLREAFGAGPTCDAATTAAKRLRSWEAPSAAERLEAWTLAACAP